MTTKFSKYCFLRKFWVRIKLFEFDKLWEILEKSSEHYEKMPYFSFKLFLQYLFEINEKNTSNGHFNFLRRWPHICICYLKNHMTFFWDFRSKLFGNILKIFPISCSKFFKLIFLGSLADNIGNGYFHYIKICLHFVSSLLLILWIILFKTKLRIDRNTPRPSLSGIKKILSHLNLPNW